MTRQTDTLNVRLLVVGISGERMCQKRCSIRRGRVFQDGNKLIQKLDVRGRGADDLSQHVRSKRPLRYRRIDGSYLRYRRLVAVESKTSPWHRLSQSYPAVIYINQCMQVADLSSFKYMLILSNILIG